jgi:hypothetical protein
MKVMQHANGFLKLVVSEYPDGTSRERVHIWDAPFTDANIHSHRWDFTSSVLAGSLRNEVYEYEDDPDGDQFRHDWQGGGPAGDGTFTYVARCRARLVDARTYRAGDVYEQDARLLHKAVVDGSAVTMVETSPVRCPVTTVIHGHLLTTRETA